MNTDIRKYVLDNFKNSCRAEITEVINASIKEHEDITLPGLGVFFEVIWNHSDKKIRDEMVLILEDNLR